MTLEELSEFGQAFYGRHWQSALARDLSVSDRTVRRWVALESPIPTGLNRKLEELLAAYADHIGDFTSNLDQSRLIHRDTHAVFQFNADGQVTVVHDGCASPGTLAVLEKMAIAVARRDLKIAKLQPFTWRDQGGMAETAKPFEAHDPAERLKRIEEIMAAARAKVAPGHDAARSADFLYDEDGLPN